MPLESVPEEVIRYHSEKLPRCLPNCNQLGRYKPGTFAGSVHQVTHPKSAIYWVKLESGPITENDMLSMHHCQVLPHLCLLQAETVVVGSQQGLRCESIGKVTTRQESVVDGSPVSPLSFTNSPSALSRPECKCSDPVRLSWAKNGLDEVWSSEEPPWT